MDMTTIDYKKVKCPKCGKSYFRVKEDSGISFTNLVFITKPDPIYKDGELQNPTEDEPIKVRCECLECGCNFRVETYDIFGDYRFIDEEEELEENKRKLAESFKVLKNETEETQTALVINTPSELESCQLKITTDYSQFADKVAVESVSDKFSKTWYDELRKELDEIKDKLSKLENKKF